MWGNMKATGSGWHLELLPVALALSGRTQSLLFSLAWGWRIQCLWLHWRLCWYGLLVCSLLNSCLPSGKIHGFGLGELMWRELQCPSRVLSLTQCGT